MVSIIDNVNEVAKGANNLGYALALPVGFYGMNTFLQERILIDARSTLIEYF